MSRPRKKSQEVDGNNFITSEKNHNEETSTEIREVGDVEEAATKVFVEPSMKLMPTLPENFNSLLGCPINLKNDDRQIQNIIKLLGNALGVDDYKTNMASFWFLDFIALQVLLFENALDNTEISVMVSWLAGEMKFIRENNFSHDAFLRAMRNIFINCSEKISRGQPLLHWNLMDFESESEKITVYEDTEQEQKEPEVSQQKITKHRISRLKNIPSKDRPKHSAKSMDAAKTEETEIIGRAEDIANLEVHSSDILDIVIEATYNMYGDSFHYALIKAAFVDPVQMHEYTLPITFRQPRPLKIFETNKHTNKITAEKSQDAARPRKSKELKNKKTNGKKTKKNVDVETIEAIEKLSTPPILTEEEILKKRREYILPLMEAIETSAILEAYKEMQAK